MTKLEFRDKVVEPRIEKIRDVLSTKSAEYAPGLDVFHNFQESVGMSFHKCREKVAWEMMVKHLTSIKDLLDMCELHDFSSNVTPALIEEKFGDAINYFILMEGMVKETLNFADLKKARIAHTYNYASAGIDAQLVYHLQNQAENEQHSY
jgi:hypothetical protein